MRGVAYTGNNMRKSLSAHTDIEKLVTHGMKAVYHSYNNMKTKQRARTSCVPRPSCNRQSGSRSAQPIPPA